MGELLAFYLEIVHDGGLIVLSLINDEIYAPEMIHGLDNIINIDGIVSYTDYIRFKNISCLIPSLTANCDTDIYSIGKFDYNFPQRSGLLADIGKQFNHIWIKLQKLINLPPKMKHKISPHFYAVKLRSKLTGSSFIRFCIVGVIATGIHYGVYWLMLLILKPVLAYTIGYATSFICNFILTTKFTFNTNASVKRGLGFALSHLVNYGLQTGCLCLFLKIGLSSQIAPIPVYCICVPVNYLLVRFVFNKL